MTDLVKKVESTGVSISQGFGDSGISSEDLQIPTLQLVQKMSKAVDAGTAKAGDIFDSSEGTVVADEKTKLEFIPLRMVKSWQIFEVTGPTTKKYIETVQYAPDNAHWRYEDGSIRRSLVMTWFCLLAKDLESGGALPYRISFKGMSMKTGKKLATLVAKAGMAKLPAYGRSYFLSSVKETNDKGTYHVYDVVPGNLSSKGWVSIAESWAPVVGSKPSHVEETDEDE